MELLTTSYAWLALCVCFVLVASAATQDEQEILADAGSMGARANDRRQRYDGITINKPVMRVIDDQSEQFRFADDVRNDNDDDGNVEANLPSVRCFCNLPACISTGYMCKSKFGGCFSDLRNDPASVYRGRHGCVEYLSDREQRERCQRLPNGSRYPVTRPKTVSIHPRALVYCCHEDMCNHADSPQTKDLILTTNEAAAHLQHAQDAEMPTTGEENRVVGSHIDTGYSDSDVWFKAATIAVPICGAVILFVLIAMAIRLLKTESLNHSNYKLGCHVHQQGGKHNCSKHAHYCLPLTTEPFLREKDVRPREPSAPIVLTKNLNEQQNNFDYNLLPKQAATDSHAYDNAITMNNLLIAPLSPSKDKVIATEKS